MDFSLPDHPPSALVIHPCCDGCADARTWLLAADRAHAASDRGPDRGLGWLSRHFRWGPTAWPSAWCDLLDAETADCGVFANIAVTLLTARGVRCERLQLVEVATCAQTALWRTQWQDAGCPPSWVLSDRAVYHEALVLHTDRGAELFDTTEFRPVGEDASPIWSRRWPQDWIRCQAGAVGIRG